MAHESEERKRWRGFPDENGWNGKLGADFLKMRAWTLKLALADQAQALNLED